MAQQVRRSSVVAAFVKTRGISPVKTRLAKDIGVAAAESAYDELVEMTRATLTCARTVNASIEPIWAVAESRGMQAACWQDLRRIQQHPGELGQRLHHAYDQLRHEGAFGVLLIGADCPYLTSAYIVAAHDFVCGSEHRRAVLGRSNDGGFYLFGANFAIPAEVWTKTTYSCTTTAQQLLLNMGSDYEMLELPVLSDIDTGADWLNWGHTRVSPLS